MAEASKKAQLLWELDVEGIGGGLPCEWLT